MMKRGARLFICHDAGDGVEVLAAWLVDAMSAHGVIAQSQPIPATADHPGGMWIETASNATELATFSAVPGGPADMVIATNHMDVLRLARAGWIAPERTNVVTSTSRRAEPGESQIDPLQVLTEDELHAAIEHLTWRYSAVDTDGIGQWFDLSHGAMAPLLFGAVCATGAINLDPAICRRVVAHTHAGTGLGIELIRAFDIGMQHGARVGRPVARERSAQQALRTSIADIRVADRHEALLLLERAASSYRGETRTAAMDGVINAISHGGPEHASTYLDLLDSIVAAERAHAGGQHSVDWTVTSAAATHLATMMCRPDRAWVAQRIASDATATTVADRALQRRGVDTWRRYHVAADLDDADASVAEVPELTAVNPSRIRDAIRVRRWRRTATADRPAVTEALAIANDYVATIEDALKVDHGLAMTVARSGGIIQGAGPTRSALEVTATAFWGRVVRQSIAVDRAAGDADFAIAHQIIPHVWGELMAHGPVRLWDYAGAVVAIALDFARQSDHDAARTAAASIAGVSQPSDRATG